jgi:hypothetical protein
MAFQYTQRDFNPISPYIQWIYCIDTVYSILE